MAALLGGRKVILSSILFIILCLQIHHISAQPIHYYCNNSIGNYSYSSYFPSNLNIISSSITSHVDTYGFYNNTVGDGVDKINAIAYCRGDVDIASCRSCINDAAHSLIVICPNQKEAIVWYDECMFRYSNNTILGIMSLDSTYRLTNTKNASYVQLFSLELLKFAGKKNSDPNSPTVSPTVSPITYDDGFVSDDERNANIAGKVITLIVIPFFLVLTCTACRFICNCISRSDDLDGQTQQPINRSTLNLLELGHGYHGPLKEEKPESVGDGEIRQYDFSLILAATNVFSISNLLGKGGFGEVYKGVLPNGEEIAVKRLSPTSSQGEEEFRNEVMLLAKLQHKCLVRLLGYCLEQRERLLVYDFMKNGSLDKVLFDEVNRSRLDWSLRYKIINSVAKGLLYLHEDSRIMIIHRDLKASNILLDEKMNAKISDFGTAKLFTIDESEANTKKIVGTLGYISPEYAMYGMFSVKSDVYSFGVLLLEIINGRRNNYNVTEDRQEGLPIYAYKTWREGETFKLIDPMLTAESSSLEIMLRYIQIALLCVQDDIRSRPKMDTLVIMLQSTSIYLPSPSEPGFYNNTRSWFSEIQESISSTT